MRKPFIATFAGKCCMEKTSDVELIGINDCVAVCQLSIETLRKYKTLGLITPCKKKGKKDLYNKKASPPLSFKIYFHIRRYRI